MAFWWANQGQSHEWKNGYLWASEKDKKGVINQTHENVLSVQPGNIIFSYDGGEIIAVGVSLTRGFKTKTPEERVENGVPPEINGYRANIIYRVFENEKKIKFQDIKEQVSRYEQEDKREHSLLDKNLNPKEGYLYSISPALGWYLLFKINEK